MPLEKLLNLKRKIEERIGSVREQREDISSDKALATILLLYAQLLITTK